MAVETAVRQVGGHILQTLTIENWITLIVSST